jgi:hypothetical protein
MYRSGVEFGAQLGKNSFLIKAQHTFSKREVVFACEFKPDEKRVIIKTTLSLEHAIANMQSIVQRK